MNLVYTSVILGLIAAALFLLAAFKVAALGGVELGWLGACFLALALVVPGLRRSPP